MKMINIQINDDIFHDFIDMLDHCADAEYPDINGEIAERILKELEEDD